MSGKPRLDSRWPDCIDWPNAKNAAGYGIRRWRHTTWLAHRVVWTKANGEIPEGLQVAHHCDNPPCVNVAHLYLATNAENQADKARRGRARTLARKGAENPYARLSESQVVEVRMLYATGRYSQKTIGNLFGVTGGTIGCIVRGKTWQAEAVGPVARGLNPLCKRGHIRTKPTACRRCRSEDHHRWVLKKRARSG